MSDPLQDRREKLIEDHLAQLGEDFESVVILASNYEGESGTKFISRTHGNVYAAMGMADRYLETGLEDSEDDE